MKLDAFIHELGGRGRLSEQLETICSTSSATGAALAVVGEDDCFCLAHGRDGSGEEFRVTSPLGVGCAVKVFVAALFAALESKGEVTLDDRIGQHLDLETPADDRVYSGMTLRHLLTHTDGIGYRALSSVPKTQSGFIDVPELSRVICEYEPTFQSGQYCTNSYCGFGLLGAVVEKRFERPLAEVIEREFLGLLGDRNSAVAESVCPVSGTGLELSAIGLSDFLKFHLDPSAFDVPLFRGIDDFSTLFDSSKAYPGWAGAITGTGLAWKTVVGGWVGHNGLSQGHTIILRIHPSRRVAIGFLCLDGVAGSYAAMGRLLGSVLPEYDRKDAPRILTEDERRSIPVSRYAGRFRNGTRTAVVSADNADHLTVTITQSTKQEQSVVAHAELVAATKGLFFLRPAAPGMLVLQHLRSNGGERFDLLWDASNLWKSG